MSQLTNINNDSDVRDTPMASDTQAKESNVLTKIIDTKAAHMAALKLRFPEASLSPKQSDRSLYDALKAPNAGFILECKKASPSKGLIRGVFDVDAIADVYNHYAAGISVLTDEQFFQGDMDYIPRVRARVKQPILCKDFFVDTYQIKLAAHQGADAILLMLSVLDDNQYQTLAAEAAKYQLDILTEVSNDAELTRAIALNAAIIGINNRNLRDLSTDLSTTEALAPHIPADRVVISESGIYNQAQVRRLASLVDGFLVGSSLMAEDDLDLACRTLTLGHNKVCGLTRIEDLIEVAQKGAVYGGLIFAQKSPRAVTKARALELVTALNATTYKLNLVGVFVNENSDEIAAIAKQLGLYAVQLHGTETSLEIDALKQALVKQNSQCQVWKAVAIDSCNNNVELNVPSNADRILFDSKSDGQFGGTGQAFDWQQSLPNRSDALLAGGLSADNAEQAASQGFYGLDFNSGLEQSPGIKDHQLISQTFAKLRQY
ncbi:bifunctional indole-3-glycerol phosphate synthase/phosphoribosylanthranilate isomerase [Shewanella sp. c952]|nr:bifunctional indole-3-glycerol phosphate synthase/phosphoribosylanthranilate isomerase [Shewanella sp. c952]